MNAPGAADERTAAFDDRDLVIELAMLAVEHVAPEELVVFDEVAAEFFRDPGRAVGARSRDESLGFGLDLTLVGPYALLAAGTVVQFLGGLALDLAKDLVLDMAKDSAKPLVRDLVHRMLARREPQPDPAAARIELSAAEVGRLRESSRATAVAAGLPEDRARLLADAIVGSLRRDPR